MKSTYLNRIPQLIAGCALAAIGSSVMAATTWNFSTCNGTAANQTGAGTFGNSWSCAAAAGTNKVTVSGWGGANAGGTTGFQTANVSNQGTSGFGLASRYEASLNGGVIANIPSPDHAIDNSPTNPTPDLIVLKFDTAVALGTVTTGWVQTDSDFTLLAYTAGTPTILGKNATNLATGWALVQDYAGDANTGSRLVNPTSLVSSWWLISAYSASYAGGTFNTTTLDYFKLLSVASKDLVNPPTGTGVPEPGSLALMGAALAGMMAIRRRKDQIA